MHGKLQLILWNDVLYFALLRIDAGIDLRLNGCVLQRNRYSKRFRLINLLQFLYAVVLGTLISLERK